MASKFKKYSVACATMAGIGSSLVMSSSAFTGTGSALIVSSDVFASPYNAHNYVRSTSDVLNDIFEVFCNKGYIKVVDDESKLEAKFKFEDQAASAFVPQKIVNLSFLTGEKVDISLLGYLLNDGRFLTGLAYDDYVAGMVELFRKALDSELNNSMLYNNIVAFRFPLVVALFFYLGHKFTKMYYAGKVDSLEAQCEKFDNIVKVANLKAKQKLSENRLSSGVDESLQEAKDASLAVFGGNSLYGDGNLKKESKNVIRKAFSFFINGLFNRSNSEQMSKVSGEGVE